MYSLFGVLVYFAAMVPAVIFTLDGSESLAQSFWAVPFLLVNLPLAFLLYHDVHKRRVHHKNYQQGNVLYEPIIWIFFAGFFGFFAGIIYFHMTHKEKPLPSGVTEADKTALITFSWIFAVAAGVVILYGNATATLIVIGIYALLNIITIHWMRRYRNYTGAKALIAAFMLFLILYFAFSGVL
jgi:hypothetical protein